MERVAVLGTGTMGPAIAAAIAGSGRDVTVWGRRREALAAAVGSAEAALGDLVAARLTAPETGRVRGEAELHGAVADAEIVIEAVTEDTAVKRALLASVEGAARPDALLASTTSGLPVDDFAGALQRPERALALHFWNPAHLMPLVEVAGGHATAPEVVEAGCAFVRQLGKHPVVLRRSVAGFIGTRLQQAVVREAIALLADGVADADAIDAATRLSFGARFPIIGPLETSDLGGLDVVAAIHDYLLNDLDRSTAPHPDLLARVARGELGAKSGRGFYDWTARDAAALVRRRDAELVARVRQLREAGDLRLPGRRP